MSTKIDSLGQVSKSGATTENTLRLRIAARQSALAQWQAREVGNAILATYGHDSSASPGPRRPRLEIEYNFRESLGDQRGEDPLWKMPAKGVFTEDFVADLHEGRADLVVHSWKDLPTDPRPGLEILATLPRASAEDVLLIKPEWRGGFLRVFTSSPRRSWALPRVLRWALPPSQAVTELEFRPVRGNIATRLRKWRSDSTIDAIVVALAALDRLLEDEEKQGPALYPDSPPDTGRGIAAQLQGAKWMILPLSEFPTAPAQGALAIEGRADREDLRQLLSPIHCAKTAEAAERERNILRAQGGGCHQKLGVSVRAIPGADWWTVVRGESEEGVSLNDEDLTSAWVGVPTEKIFGSQEYDRKFWKREPLENLVWPWRLSDRNRRGPRGVFVSRISAWPESPDLQASMQDQEIDFVFCAGVKTWHQLAARYDVWINACADSLGEEALPAWKRLCAAIVGGPQRLKSSEAWELYRLTHEAAPDRGDWRSWPTYRVFPDLRAKEFTESALDSASLLATEDQLRARLRDCTHYYWMSRQQFEYCVRLVPEIRGRVSGCGPGKTWWELKACWEQAAKAGVAMGPLQVLLAQSILRRSQS
jgi:hydroxymethylbilane synthase